MVKPRNRIFEGKYGKIKVGLNHLKPEDYWESPELGAVFIKNETVHGGPSSNAVSLEVAEEITDWILEIVAAVHEAKPKEPTRAEIWAQAPLGSILSNPVTTAEFIKVGHNHYALVNPVVYNVTLLTEENFSTQWSINAKEN